jgi:hypothetical protein
VDIVELVGEEPGVFDVVDFELAVWWDTDGQLYRGSNRGGVDAQLWLDGT